MTNIKLSLRLVLIAAVSMLYSGCASVPAQNTVATVQVYKVFAHRDKYGLSLRPSELAGLRAAGVDDNEVAAGRVVGVHCAVMADGWWDSLAVLPPGLQAGEGTTLRVRVVDPGDNQRLGVSTVVDVPAQLPSRELAYRYVPNWRELGRRNNFERIELPPQLRDKYLIVQGSYLLKCNP
ncbi:hypothetical protein EZ313_19305 [Ramlibacter henchirensis]|uniref:Uncharacterized protein n=1 Tax=Ramlibacter henchirensis TaxID=204072 RepID=A0A4Z0BQ87_9BURK|nr:hypothetical protein [Ramlibacter henchirensis]TFZ00604.1 hypothetical protein EZ313_19305 [Ramlibacter henchirensis]